MKPTWNLIEEVRSGRVPKVFYESDDPDRMVPLVWKPDDYMIVVTGDPARNSAYVFAHNGVLGYPVAKKINLPQAAAREQKQQQGEHVTAPQHDVTYPHRAAVLNVTSEEATSEPRISCRQRQTRL